MLAANFTLVGLGQYWPCRVCSTPLIVNDVDFDECRAIVHDTHFCTRVFLRPYRSEVIASQVGPEGRWRGVGELAFLGEVQSKGEDGRPEGLMIRFQKQCPRGHHIGAIRQPLLWAGNDPCDLEVIERSIPSCRPGPML